MGISSNTLQAWKSITSELIESKSMMSEKTVKEITSTHLFRVDFAVGRWWRGGGGLGDEERIASTSQITGISDLCFGFEPRFAAISSRTSTKPMGNVEHHGKIRGVGLPRPREEDRKAAENWS
ncbi:hypothetical protein Droror1_Dr00016681 [Drosera rotundifolia]